MIADQKPIAVIGAGIAGLSCAARLLAAGHSVEVIEKSRGPGGRAATRRGDDWQCDHGAQYFTARSPAFLAAVEEWRAAGVVAEWQPRLLAVDIDGPVRKGQDELRLVGTPRMSAISRHLAAGLPVRYETRVTALGLEGDDWILDTEEHGVLEQAYSGVILTLPSQQAFALLVEASPGLADLAAQNPMRGCWALMARYAEDPGLDFDAAFVNVGALSWVARDSSKPGRPEGHVWLLHAPAADDIGGESEEELAEVAEAMIEEFSQLGAPRPDDFVLHRWRFADCPDAPEVGSVWDPVDRIGIAGDWLMGGRIEGAWLSGRQLADAVIASALEEED
ncbi:MAG: FAD-dependent oxidoreductase [Zoogloeaceae bacterium]|nr:FAD-dependent oxidoreductase [Zoogloeaceae bacterium]